MVGYFAFQWGRLFFQMGGFIFMCGGSAPWGASVLMGGGGCFEKILGGGCPIRGPLVLVGGVLKKS